MPALLAVRVRGSVCVSHLRLGDRSVRLGRTGYVTGWRDVPFQFPVLNQSPVATVCKITRMPEVIELPDAEIGADGSLCIPLQPFETLHVSAKLRGSLLQAPQAKERPKDGQKRRAASPTPRPAVTTALTEPSFGGSVMASSGGRSNAGVMAIVGLIVLAGVGYLLFTIMGQK